MGKNTTILFHFLELKMNTKRMKADSQIFGKKGNKSERTTP